MTTSDPAGKARLFLALWPSPGVRDQLLSWRDAWRWPSNATPVRPERLHLTLHFLGDVAAARLPELADGLRVPFQPFELHFGAAQLWQHGIAVLEPAKAPERLLSLHAALGEALRALALPPESRSYRPHVTLARRAGHAIPPEGGPAIRWRVRSYVLIHSSLGARPAYTVLQRYR